MTSQKKKEHKECTNEESMNRDVMRTLVGKGVHRVFQKVKPLSMLMFSSVIPNFI